MNNTDLNLTTLKGSNGRNDLGLKDDIVISGESITSCQSITGLSSIYSITSHIDDICVSPHIYNNYSTIGSSMSEELYLYITGGKACVSTMPPTWNSQENCLWHAKGSRVLSIEGDYGLSRLIKSYIGSELDVIYTYLTINGFNVYATILRPSGELFVEKAPIKGKENLIHRSRKK